MSNSPRATTGMTHARASAIPPPHCGRRSPSVQLSPDILVRPHRWPRSSRCLTFSLASGWLPADEPVVVWERSHVQ